LANIFFVKALAHAQEKSKDSQWRFEWVKNGLGSERTNSDDLLIQIRIPPIRERQYARLRPFNPFASKSLPDSLEVDHCTFEGHLENDPDSYVTVTEGCPGEDSFEVKSHQIVFFSNLHFVQWLPLDTYSKQGVQTIQIHCSQWYWNSS
jgi:hypothetical protein